MAEYVALLRGINVTGHKKIKMEDLRRAAVSWGLENVRTVLATGNLVFESPLTDPGSLASSVHDQIQTSFDLEVSVIVRALPEIRDLVDDSPFKGIPVTPPDQALCDIPPGEAGQPSGDSL